MLIGSPAQSLLISMLILGVYEGHHFILTLVIRGVVADVDVRVERRFP